VSTVAKLCEWEDRLAAKSKIVRKQASLVNLTVQVPG
jgi:hypothetical protein